MQWQQRRVCQYGHETRSVRQMLMFSARRKQPKEDQRQERDQPWCLATWAQTMRAVAHRNLYEVRPRHCKQNCAALFFHHFVGETKHHSVHKNHPASLRRNLPLIRSSGSNGSKTWTVMPIRRINMFLSSLRHFHVHRQHQGAHVQSEGRPFPSNLLLKHLRKAVLCTWLEIHTPLCICE